MNCVVRYAWRYVALSAVLVWLAACGELRAQTLNLFDIDASSHPVMRAKFYAIDASGNQQRPSVSDLTITENGLRRTITKVTCPPPVPPKALSSVLVIDVSGSMAHGAGTVPNIELAKVAARAWVNGLPFGESECAITTFNSRNMLNLDFTKDRKRALSAIETLSPGGGTDYNRALSMPLAGGLQITRKGMNKRVIVMLTDGQPNTPPNVASIVSEANRQNCVIYCVTLGMPAPQSLFDIASGTGGRVFENVTTVEQAEAVYLSILRSVRGLDPCTVEWLSDVVCKSESVDASLRWQALNSNGRYEIPQSAVASLEFSPNFHRFENPPIGVQLTQNVTVTARRSAFSVKNIVASNPAFSVAPSSFTLQPDESITLTMTYTAADSGYAYCRFSLENPLCERTFFAAGGYRGKKPRDGGLRVVHPNGGETFVVGSDTVILWDGVPPEELVTLEYSVDNGSTWKLVDTARGLSYPWKNVPRPTSRTCLVRASQYTDPNGRSYGQPNLILKGHFGAAKCLAYSPDGTRIVTGGFDGTLRIWNSLTGEPLRTIADRRYPFESVMFSPDNTTILASDGACRTRDAQSGRIVHTFEENSIPGVCFSPDGGMVASGSIVDSGGVAGSLSLWNAKNGKLIETLVKRDGIIRVVFSPDGMTMATLGGPRGALQIKIWNAVTGDVIHSLHSFDKDVVDASLAYSPDGKTLAFSSENTVRLMDVFSKQVVVTMTSTNGGIKGLAFSSSGNLLASGCGFFVDLWDVSSGLLIRTFDVPNSGVATTAVAISPDGATLAASKLDGTVKLWTIDEEPLQQDQSDSVFTIVEPLPVAIDVDMQRCLVGMTKDSVVKGLVGNVGTYPFAVRRISFSGADASAFSLVSGLPEYTVAPGGSRIGELRFQPTRVGLHQAQIIIETQSGVLTRSIRGVGIAPSLQVVCPIVDFGSIALGTNKDTLGVASIRNSGAEPVTITGVRHAGPNASDFTTQAGGGSFTLQPGETRQMNLRFTPSEIGRTSGSIEFSYNGPDSPAIMQLFGEATRCSSRQLTYPLEEMVLVGDATLDSASINLTPSRTYTAGVAWFPKKILVADGFDIRFRFAMFDGSDNGLPDSGSKGADGIALVIHNTTKFDVGTHGDGIGYHGMPSGVAVEFDAYRNPAFADPTPHHIAVQVGDGRILRPWHLPPYLRAITSEGVPLFEADGTVYHARVTLQGQRLSVYCDTLGDLTQPILVVDSLDLGAYMSRSYDGSAFVGFTSATGLSQQQHKLFGLTLDDCAQLVSVDEAEVRELPLSVVAQIVPTPSYGDARIDFTEPLPALARCAVYDTRGLDVASFEVPAGSVSSPLPLKGLPYGSYRVQVQIDRNVIVVPLLLAP